jgi:glycosyltransferase involved in cell wall biosynthesis
MGYLPEGVLITLILFVTPNIVNASALNINYRLELEVQQVDKVDLGMWTKNGAATLPAVLKRIEQVIPSRYVNNKIISDDQSTDNTVEICESFGWQVIKNDGKGISDGANNVLKHITTEKFVSFEQDLYLAKDWWDKVPPMLEKKEIGAASGMRFANKPPAVKKLQQYVAKKYRGEAYLASWLRTRQMAAFTLGKTLDNTIYKTEAVRKIGGFPKIKVNAGVDTTLAYRMQEAGFYWIVDYNVQSIHIRQGLRQELKHQYWYGTQLDEIWGRIELETNKPPPITRSSIMSRFL